MTATMTRKPVSTGREIYGIERRAAVGSAIELDGGKCGRLLPGDDFCDSGYPGCDFRFPLEYGPIKSLAVNIFVTGRQLKLRWGGELWVRVKIEWVGDCEPSTFSGGWLKVRE